MKTTWSIRNYYKPTPIKWRIVGDLLILLIPIFTVLISEAPNLDDAVKYWLGGGLNIALVIGKYITNGFSEEQAPPTN